MASGRGPPVRRLSLLSCTAYSHCRPKAVEFRPVGSLLLGLKMKLPVAWFFTAGKGEGYTQILFPSGALASCLSAIHAHSQRWAWGHQCLAYPYTRFSHRLAARPALAGRSLWPKLQRKFQNFCLLQRSMS